MRKLTALIAGGAGYVLGAKAGRQRYEQLRSQFNKVKTNPKVQQASTKATDAAKGAAPVIKEKVSGVTDKTKSSPSTSTGTSTYATGTTTAAGAAGVGGGLAADEVIVDDLTDDATVGPLTQPDVLTTDGDSTTIR
jgi:hypothetical protein